MVDFIPPQKSKLFITGGARYGIHGLMIGLLFGIVFAFFVYQIWNTVWVIVSIPVCAATGFFTRRMTVKPGSVTPNNVLWWKRK
jgi:uncharacterized membrane protein